MYLVRNNVYVGGTCQSNIHMIARTQDKRAEYYPIAGLLFLIRNPGAISIPIKQHTHTHTPSYAHDIRKYEWSEQAIFFPVSLLQF